MSLDLVKPAQTALLVGPSAEARTALTGLERTEANHAAAMASLSCLQRVEAPATSLAAPLAFPLTIGTWNLERCYAVEQSAALLEREGVEIALLSEVDNGMARTGQRHTTHDMAEALGMAHAFGVEFLELELGASVELEFCSDDFNRHGFHGNALLARAALQAPVMIRLEAHGHWFRPESPAHRIGTRCAVAATVMTSEGPLQLVSVHLENAADAAYRAQQLAGLLDAIDQLAGDTPVIIGGDLNTAIEPGGDLEQESLFALSRARGLARHAGAEGQVTTRPSRVSRNPRGAYQLDWFLTRGVIVEESRIVAAVAPDGEVLSDHDMVVLKVGGLAR